MQALGCFFVLVFAIVFMLAGAIGNILRILLGFPPRQRKDGGASARPGNQGTRRASRPNSRHRRAQKSKIFGQDEGEYVDFEEIRE